MDNQQIKISREDLYERVWSTPMRKLASEYGLSDRGLAKLCKRHNIPVPGVGYWAKIEHNKPVKKIPLPNFDGDDEIIISILNKENEYVDEEQFCQAESIIKAIKNEKEPIEVSESLVNPHTLVNRAYKSLRNAKKNQNEILCPKTNKCLAIQVSPGSLMRALCVMDALIKKLEKYGFRISLSNKSMITSVKVLGKEISIGLEEKYDSFEIELSSKQKKEREKSPWMYDSPQYRYVPNGKLLLKIYLDRSIKGIRKQWSDGDRTKIERLIDKFVIGLIKTAVKVRSEEIRSEIIQKKWEEKRRREVELQKQKWEEQKRIDHLEGEVKAWIHSQNVRSYLSAVREILIKKYGKIGQESQADIWLKWVDSYANRIDPLFVDP